MFARKLSYEGSVKRVKRSFGRGIPFELETRKRQAVSCGLPKLEPGEEKNMKSKAGGKHADKKDNMKKLAAADSSGSLSSREDEESPTAAPTVYNRESRLEEPKTLRRSKSITFAEGTKTWMGPRRVRHFTDELLFQFFIKSKKFSSTDVIKLIGMDYQLIGGVRAMLDDLCERILEHSTSEEDGVPVLLEGGGRGMKMSVFHHPYLVNLRRVVAEAERVSELRISLCGAGMDSSGAHEDDSSVEDDEDSDRVETDEDKVEDIKRNFDESDNSNDPLVRDVLILRNVRIEDPAEDLERRDEQQQQQQQSNNIIGSQQQQQQQHPHALTA